MPMLETRHVPSSPCFLRRRSALRPPLDSRRTGLSPACPRHRAKAGGRHCACTGNKGGLARGGVPDCAGRGQPRSRSARSTSAESPHGQEKGYDRSPPSVIHKCDSQAGQSAVGGPRSLHDGPRSQRTSCRDAESHPVPDQRDWGRSWSRPEAHKLALIPCGIKAGILRRG
jgi:hypothetical protein